MGNVTLLSTLLCLLPVAGGAGSWAK